MRTVRLDRGDGPRGPDGGGDPGIGDPGIGDPGGRARVVLVDAWELDPAPDAPASCLHLVLAGEVTVRPGGANVVVLDGAGTAELTWEPPVTPVVTERVLDDPMLTGVWGTHLTRLSLPAEGDVGSLTVTVREAR